MATFSDDNLPSLQHEIQRLLGRCMLRLQQYEYLLKKILAHHDISGPIETLDQVFADHENSLSRRTLGDLVRQIFRSYFVSLESNTPDETTDKSDNDCGWVTQKFSIRFTQDDLARMKNNLREFVNLRNDLVHHFIVEHDIWTEDGCQRARDRLISNYDHIEQQFAELRALAERMDNAQRLMLEALQSDEVREAFVNGIPVNDSLH